MTDRVPPQITEPTEKKKNKARTKNAREENQDLEKAKMMARLYEEGNRDKLYVFKSKGGWWKMGWTSALVYYHRLGRQIGSKARLMEDLDFYSRSKDGIISIRAIEPLKDSLKELKIYPNGDQTQEGLLYVFDLGYELTDEDLKMMREDEETRRQKMNQMVLPKVYNPDMNMEIVKVTKYIFSIYRKMNAAERDLMGKSMIESVHRLLKAFSRLSKGLAPEQQMLREIYAVADDLEMMIKTAKDMEMWPTKTELETVSSLTKITRLARKQMKSDE